MAAKNSVDDEWFFDGRENNARPSMTELEMDALTELVNIGVSRAAHSLRDLLGEQVF